MRNFQETFPRLLIIYEHFAEGKLNEDYSWYPGLLLLTDAPVTIIGKKRTYYDAYSFVYGELVHLFSEWVNHGYIRYTRKPRLDEDKALRHFLGLNKREFMHLFIPYMQSDDYGGEELDVSATPQQVALNIKIFLERELDKQSRIRLKQVNP